MSQHLQELGAVAVSHRQQVEEVKRQLGIKHDEFDCWLYGFLENKKFNVEETLSKLRRRFEMEVNELARYEFTDYMRDSLCSGIMQIIGNDKDGRVVFYVTTCRDRPEAHQREEKTRTFDMMVSYGTRLRADCRRCQMALLINQEKASLWKNTDMTFQANIALRIAKFYPGCVDRIYICNMNSMLAAMAKPIFAQFPPIVSERIIIITDSEKRAGKLLEFIDEAVLPVALGGTNDCDRQENYTQFYVTIKEYYEQLKHAVLQRGLTVKEWELESIQPPRTRSGMQSMITDGENMTPLQTCCSSFISSFDNERNFYEMHAATADAVDQWRAIMQVFPQSLSVFFLEQLQRCRLATESEEAAARYRLVDWHTEWCARNMESLPEIDLADKKWYRQIPEPLRAFYRLFLIGLTVVNAAYFICALVFFALFTADILVALFFGFLVQWNYVFPLGAALIMSALQGGTLCSRALSVVVALVHRNVIPPFAHIGAHLGGVAQIALFAVIASVQLIIFSIYAARGGVATGLQVSFASGCLCAVIFLTACHVVFFFDWLGKGKHVRSGNSSMRFPFFLLLTLHEGDGKMDKPCKASTLSCIICSVPSIAGILFGIALLISGSIAFASAMLTATIIASFTVNFYLETRLNAPCSFVFRIAFFISCMVWLFDCYVFGFRSQRGQWMLSVALASAVALLCLVFALVCVLRNDMGRLLRSLVVALLLLLVACWIAQFPILGWEVGVFCSILLVHNVLGTLLNRPDHTNVGGVFSLYLSVALLTTFSLLLGWYGTSPRNEIPRSLPRTAPASPLGPLQQYHRYPVCSMRTAGGLTITDFALLTELVNAHGAHVFAEDFKNWFNTTDITYAGVVQQFDTEDLPWNLHRFDSVAHNITVLTLHNQQVLSSILSMMVWSSSVVFFPVFIFFPLEWSTVVVDILSLRTHLVDFPWMGVQRSLTRYLEDFQRTSTRETVLTGSGVAGGMASIAGARSRTQVIVFGSPGLKYILKLVGISAADYHKHVLEVGSENTLLDTLGDHDETLSQKLRCNALSNTCMSMEYISTELLDSCDTSGRRHVPI